MREHDDGDHVVGIAKGVDDVQGNSFLRHSEGLRSKDHVPDPRTPTSGKTVVKVLTNQAGSRDVLATEHLRGVGLGWVASDGVGSGKVWLGWVRSCWR